MSNSKSKSQIEEEEEQFHDAQDDFPFHDCSETFSEKYISSNKIKTLAHPTLRRRISKVSSSVNSDNNNNNCSNSSERNISFPPNVEESENKSEISIVDNVGVEKNEEVNSSSSSYRKLTLYRKAKDNLIKKNLEIKHEPECSINNEEHSNITDTSNEDTVIRDNVVGNEEIDDTNSSLLITLVDLVIKCMIFQIHLFVNFITFPVSLLYYLYMLVFNPFELLKRCRECLVYKVKRVWSVLSGIVSPFVYEWFKEHREIWKLCLKCGWGLLWSGYVCFVLVGLFVTAFVMGGILIRVVVEEPIRMERSLNFDFSEKSPVAYVPIVAPVELSHDVYLAEKAEIWKGGGSRVIPFGYKLKVAVSLTLPESDYNQNLGMFQVRVDFLNADGKTLASSRRPCMLHFRSYPIRLLLTFLKVAPILTGYTTETQNLKVNFRGFTEGKIPTACLRVVIEQRAQYLPGAGIPEMYAASLALESELPLLKKVVWFWRKTLFVWISMTIFSVELAFALLCCRPFVIPRVRLREASNREALDNDGRGQT